ncbi:MAG: hypothetical protein P8M80_06765 [Pirellulaceae bacterium]|nr:hypothetical protein [Pirellulaceae bacterium]
MSKIICDDHIDILVDIAGHSHGNRLEMLANKPAPIQILWPGFAGSTGIQGMDFIVADQWTIPEHEAGGYTEEPLRLPFCFTCFIKPDESPSSQIKPVQRPNELVFGCLSSMQFIGPNVIQCWAKILESVPDSRLVIKNRELSNDSVRERISSLFIEYGIPFSRLLLEGEDAADNASDLLEKIDVGLDPFPCSDFENAFQFLSRGVPVISKSGQRYAGNQTTSLLQNLGLTEFCVQTDEGYLQCARSVANDSSGLADLRLGLPQRVRSSRVCDVPKFVTDLQDLFSKALTQRNR